MTAIDAIVWVMANVFGLIVFVLTWMYVRSSTGDDRFAAVMTAIMWVGGVVAAAAVPGRLVLGAPVMVASGVVVVLAWRSSRRRT